MIIWGKILALVFAFFLLLLVVRSSLLRSLFFLIFFYVALNLVQPPIPSSVVTLYMIVAVVCVLIYVTIDRTRLRDFVMPLVILIREERRNIARGTLFIVIPILVGYLTFVRVIPRYEPPAEPRTVHPEPPSELKLYGRTVAMKLLQNPFRKDKAKYQQYVKEGAEIYFQNCFFCHGDNQDGRGHFAHGFNPLPANFRDPGTIAQLQESYVFWRIAKGGQGLPPSAQPWNSAMPAWEEILTEDQIWKVILYIYDASGVSPRTWE